MEVLTNLTSMFDFSSSIFIFKLNDKVENFI